MGKMLNKLGHQTGKILRDLVQIPAIIVESVDEKLHDYGDKKLDQIIDYRTAEAMKNPEYAEIEARRKTSNGNIIMLSDEDNLTMEHWDHQHKIYAETTHEPLLMPFYRYLRNYPIGQAIGLIKRAGQRLYKGWDYTATWSLDYHLTSTLGAQLHHLANTTHGWPQSDKFPEFKDWQKALHKNADMLIAYANRDEVLFAKDTPYDREKEEQLIKDGQKALRWVATYLPNLWD